MLRSLADIEEKAAPWKRLHSIAFNYKKTEYPWKRMSIGDAFRFGEIGPATARRLAGRAGERHGRRFVVAMIGVKMYCFRVENPDDDSTEWLDKVQSMRKSKYPWRRMKVGETFEFSDEVLPHSRRTMATWASERYDRKFIVVDTTCKRVK